MNRGKSIWINSSKIKWTKPLSMLKRRRREREKARER
jgi:hypothetical protein